MAMVDVGHVAAYTGGLSVQVGWLGRREGGRPARWPTFVKMNRVNSRSGYRSRWQQHKHCLSIIIFFFKLNFFIIIIIIIILYSRLIVSTSAIHIASSMKWRRSSFVAHRGSPCPQESDPHGQIYKSVSLFSNLKSLVTTLLLCVECDVKLYWLFYCESLS